MSIRRFLHSIKAKVDTGMIILLAAVVIGAIFIIPKLPEWGIELPFSIGGDGGAGTDMVDVNKKLQITVSDAWSGGVAAHNIYIYDETKALRESLTTAASGIIATAQNYPSGTQLYIEFDNANDHVFYSVVVPQMNLHDSEASTYNDISLTSYAIGTYTVDSLRMLGLTVSDGETVNATGNATASPTFVYTLTNTGADNTGLLESYDPIYNANWDVWVTGVISGDNASLVVVEGVDYQWVVGTSIYFADKVSAQALSKWKVGGSYVSGYEGTSGCSWGLDLTAFTTAADTATMQITFYECADPAYAMAHGGNYGTHKIELAEHTVAIVGL